MTTHCLDEETYCSMMDTAVQSAASRTKRNYLLCHIPIDKDRTDAYLAAVTLEVFNEG